MSIKKKVFVGMSGGVDSSVSAALLIDAGYDVIGVFIKVWEAPFLPCTWREERRDAQRVAAHLGIPLVTLDLADVYKKSVVDTFVASYARGETPNPDVLCNKEVKFGAFYDFAMREGADFIATGHYAQVQSSGNTEKIEEKKMHRLMRSVDTEKDQTYFLWTIKQEVLQKTLFPIGHLHKSEVRKIAEQKGLPNAVKKDSQGICFLGDVDMATFLKEFITVESGNVEDMSGNVIGTHDGAVLYTLGERHGFRVAAKDIDARPWFVVRKDVTRNVIIVGHKDAVPPPVHTSTVHVHEWHMISGRASTEILSQGPFCASLRYRQDPFSVLWHKEQPFRIELPAGSEAFASGQSVVVYRNNECLGGGSISQASS
jgi:tRNA-uridine 2-sulfurtransferase